MPVLPSSGSSNCVGSISRSFPFIVSPSKSVTLRLSGNPTSMKIRLQRVDYMPKELEPGVLYVSEEFDAAAHLCPCGCGSKIRTPLGPTDWALEENDNGPTLHPSIGNWQLPCQSHSGSLKARLYGLPNGHLSKLLQDAMPKKSGNVHTMKVLIIDDGRDFTVSGAG